MPSDGADVALPEPLSAEAYPHDEPMLACDMREYRQAIEPNMSMEDRFLFNNAREDAMGKVPMKWDLAGVLNRGRGLAIAAADFLQRCCDELEEDADVSEERHQSMASSLLRATAGTMLVGLPARAAELIDQHMASLNVLMWIAIAELLHKIFGFFSGIGCASLMFALQAFSAPFLLRCYYSLVTVMNGSDVRPAWMAAHLMGAAAVKGWKDPTLLRPPIVHLLLLARATLLVQVAYVSWAENLSALWLLFESWLSCNPLQRLAGPFG